MAITQTINLNMIPDSEPIVVRVNQYDVGEGRIIANLFNGTSAYTPAFGATAKIQGTKADKHAFQYGCSIYNGAVISDLKDQMTACKGDVRCQIVLTEGNNVTGTFAFILRVQESCLEDDADTSDTVLPDYIDAAATNAARAEAAAEAAESWSSHAPYINETTHNWMVWDEDEEDFVDSGINAEGTSGDYSHLSNQPQINDVTLSGNKSSSQLGLQSALTWDGNYLVI